MNPEKWEKAKAIFDKAANLETTDQEAFLKEACADDTELLDLVKSLLTADAEAGSLIEHPLLDFSREEDSASGKHIGPYKLVRRIGHGGMGTVYLAIRDDDQFKKQVALKLIKRGMDTEEVIKRFRSERQILASLDHAGIARLLDGGVTEDALPYLVMEYVQGQPIDEYCDDHKLKIAERLELFRKVCASVQYAHQNLIVHRDLKPSNILVTREGEIKLLDFGIAKLLNPSLLPVSIPLTQTGIKNMTPEYASPEQVKGDAITTASDVYSLGVLLYELLTSHRPYRLKSRSPWEMEQVICQQEPEKPSTAITHDEEIPGLDGTAKRKITPKSVSEKRDVKLEILQKRLSGDLDNIVLMALRKEPHRRYTSVEQFSEDIRRHLEGLPVVARKLTRTYRTRKFVERHKAGVIAAAITILALIGGLVGTTWQAQIAEKERSRAEQRFNDVRKLANSFLFEFHDAIDHLPGSTEARKLVVEKALEYLSNLSKEAEDDTSLKVELASAYYKISKIQDDRYYGGLGKPSDALQSCERAIELYEQIINMNPEHTKAQNELARNYLQKGDMLIKLGKIADAMQNYQKSLTIRQKLVANNRQDIGLQRALAVSYQRVGDTSGNPRFSNLGDTEAAFANYEKMLDIYKRLNAENPDIKGIYHSIGISYEKFGNLYEAKGDFPKALEYYQKELNIFKEVASTDPTNVRYQRDLGIGYAKVADILSKMEKYSEALVYQRNIIPIWEKITIADPQNISAKRDLGRAYGVEGYFLMKSGDMENSTASYQKALGLLSTAYEADTLNLRILNYYRNNLERLAQVELKRNRFIKANKYMQRALKLRRSLANRSNATSGHLNEYAWALLTCKPSSLRDPQTALAYANRAVKMSEEKSPNFLDTQAWAYFRTGNLQKAIEIEQKALSMIPENSPLRSDFESALKTFQAGLE